MSFSRAALVGGRLGARSSQILRQQQSYYRRNGLSSVQLFHTHVGGPWDDRRKKEQEKEQARKQLSSFAPGMQVAQYHTTAASEKGVALVLGLGALSAASYAGSSAVTAWKEYKASLPSEEELEEQRKQQEKEQAAQQKEQQQEEAQTNTKDQKQDGKRENIFQKWFGVGVGAKYWEGGFEETMTRREAALILGVRESSSPTRVKDAHRKLLVLNHPDTGGSTYVAGKINEAKELLLKGRRQNMGNK